MSVWKRPEEPQLQRHNSWNDWGGGTGRGNGATSSRGSQACGQHLWRTQGQQASVSSEDVHLHSHKSWNEWSGSTGAINGRDSQEACGINKHEQAPQSNFNANVCSERSGDTGDATGNARDDGAAASGGAGTGSSKSAASVQDEDERKKLPPLSDLAVQLERRALAAGSLQSCQMLIDKARHQALLGDAVTAEHVKHELRNSTKARYAELSNKPNGFHAMLDALLESADTPYRYYKQLPADQDAAYVQAMSLLPGSSEQGPTIIEWSPNSSPPVTPVQELPFVGASFSLPPAPAPPIVQPPWTFFLDASSQKYYIHNYATGQTLWATSLAEPPPPPPPPVPAVGTPAPPCPFVAEGQEVHVSTNGGPWYGTTGQLLGPFEWRCPLSGETQYYMASRVATDLTSPCEECEPVLLYLAGLGDAAEKSATMLNKRYEQMKSWGLPPFILLAPLRKQGYWWVVDNDEGNYGWLGEFLPEKVKLLAALVSSLVEQRPLVCTAFSAGAYCLTELIAHGQLSFKAVALGGLHGHGQPSTDGIPKKRVHTVLEKFGAYIERIRRHNGIPGGIFAAHSVSDRWSPFEFAEMILDVLGARNEVLSYPKVEFTVLPATVAGKNGHCYEDLAIWQPHIIYELLTYASPQCETRFGGSFVKQATEPVVTVRYLPEAPQKASWDVRAQTHPDYETLMRDLTKSSDPVQEV